MVLRALVWRFCYCSVLFSVMRLIMKSKYSIFNFTCSKNLLTRQRAKFKSKRRGDSAYAIATRFTCQRALCNRGKRQGDSQRLIATRFTCQRALCNRGKRQGDSQRVVATRFTCQRALYNRGKRQGDSPRVIATRFTCQRALCNRGKRQGDSQRVIATRFTCQRALRNRGKRQGDSQRVVAIRFTCQRALCNRGKRQGDSQRVIATRFTCQRALCNRGKRQGDSQRVIATRFTCQRALCNRGKRQGDSQRVIATRFTCQRALCNRGKRQGDSQRVIDTELVHGSSTWVQNRVQLKEKQSRSHEKLLELMSNYENLSETVKALCYVRQSIRLCSETQIYISDTEDDLGNKSKVNTTYNLRTYDNRKEKTAIYRPLADSSAHLCKVTVQTKHINSDKSNAFNRSSCRSRCITRHLVHVNKRDREPSRISVKNLVHSMSRNKKRRHKIKSFIRRLIPKSSALHNLLSTSYRKYVSEKLANINMWQFCKLCRASKMQ